MWLLKKLTPAFLLDDSSSGCIGFAVNSAIESIQKSSRRSEVGRAMRETLLDRLWDVIRDGDMRYLGKSA